MCKHKNIGSDFEDFLKEEGILEEVDAAAAKKAFVIQLQSELGEFQNEFDMDEWEW